MFSTTVVTEKPLQAWKLGSKAETTQLASYQQGFPLVKVHFTQPLQDCFQVTNACFEDPTLKLTKIERDKVILRMGNPQIRRSNTSYHNVQ